MRELAWPLLLMVFVSLAGGFAAAGVARRHRSTGVMIIAIAAVALLANALVFHDSLRVLKVLPWSNAVVLANPILPAAGVFIGALLIVFRGPRWQVALCMSAIACTATWRVLSPLVRPAATLRESRWTSDVCRQSTLSTCSAAAGATALRAAGIETSEAEMARLCLSTIDGTSNLALYRGLRIKAGDRGRVNPICVSADELRRRGVKNCVFSIIAEGSGVLSIAGKHSVVLFGFDEHGAADIGDPFSGRQKWSPSEFNRLWPGSGLAVSKVPLDSRDGSILSFCLHPERAAPHF